MKIFFGWCIGWVTAVIVVSLLQVQGDMNDDGLLDIRDLSILATTINEQN